MLMATKKESRNNVIPPTNTDQKEKELSPKEVKDSIILIIPTTS